MYNITRKSTSSILKSRHALLNRINANRYQKLYVEYIFFKNRNVTYRQKHDYLLKKA